MPSKQDIAILRNLANQVAEIAALPIQAQKRDLWCKLNGLNPERPMVAIDQVCWNEMNVDDELTLQCQTPLTRQYEENLRQTLYKWKHMPGDLVVDDFIKISKVVNGMNGNSFDLGVHVQESTLSTDSANGVVSHAYLNQFNTAEDLEKIKMPVISYNKAETDRRVAVAHEIFDGILDIRLDGVDPYLSVWDALSTWMSVEGMMYAMVDDPELMLDLANRLVACYMSGLDQLEREGLLVGQQEWIHCTGAWTDDLPGKNFDKTKPLTKDIWMFGLAQPFSSVSPPMFDEFEIMPNMPLFERFGLVYYGCCDPLDRKMEEVLRIPNLKKVSVSPWAKKEPCAEALGRGYVFSGKPSPAVLVPDSFDEDALRKDLLESIAVCKRYGCPLELILKDISTVKHQPKRLWRWAEIAMECVMQ